MQYVMKNFCILVFIVLALALGRCGRKSSPSPDINDRLESIAIPDGWDGEEDWSGNALQVEDIP